MSLVTTAIVLSVVGACAFVLAGYLVGRLSRRGAPALTLAPSGPPPAAPPAPPEASGARRPAEPARRRDASYREDRLAEALSRLAAEGGIDQVVLVDEQGLPCAAIDDADADELAAVGAQAVGLIQRMGDTVGSSRAVAVDLADRRVLDVRPFAVGADGYFTVSIGVRRVVEARFDEVVADLRRILGP